MRKQLPRTLVVASIVIAVLMVDVGAAMAQIAESDVDAQPGSVETTQLVTSSTEVRRAVVGLLALAFVAGVLMIVYWYKTGQQARERFLRRHGGRHMAGADAGEPIASRGEWDRRDIDHARTAAGGGHRAGSRPGAGYGSGVAPAYSVQYREPGATGVARPGRRVHTDVYDHG